MSTSTTKPTIGSTDVPAQLPLRLQNEKPQFVRITGITSLFEPEKLEDTFADIIFIHGLQGHPRGTWAWGADDTKLVTSKPITAELTKEHKGWLSTKRRCTGDNTSNCKKRARTDTHINEGVGLGSGEGSQVSSASLEADLLNAPFWPHDLLPKDCPTSRILTWGYNSVVSNFFKGSANKNSIFSHSRDLLEDLIWERRKCQDRPLIFVAHSLGGIVAKEVILKAWDSDEQPQQSLYKSTVALLFLGTPHRGSPYSDMGETMRRLVSAIGFDATNKNLRTLEVDGPLLVDCDERFQKIRKRCGFEIHTFQEAHGMKGTQILNLNEKVVPDFSSSFPLEDSKVTIDANHMMMCRYSSKDDDGYRKVAHKLQSLCENAQSQVAEQRAKLEREDEARLRSLSFPEMQYRQLEVQTTRLDSCTWIFKLQAYRDWVQIGRGLLWIKGKPGSGKSTLMKKIIQSFDSALGPKCGVIGQPIRLSFFFHRRGTSLQQTQIGMFRTMLYQLLTQVPSVREDFRILYDDKSMEGDFGKNWDWTVTELRHVFKSTLLAAAKTQPIRIFVDALDEAGEAAACSVVSYLHELSINLLEQELPTSICFSCRHYPIVMINDGSTICVEDENKDDIGSYVLLELEKLILKQAETAKTHEADIEKLQKDISSKASGVFLWAALVVPLVSKQYNEGKSFAAVSEALQRVPSDLGDVYKYILQNVVNRDECFERVHLMQLICLAERPLSLTELRLAIASDDSQIHPSRRSFRESTGFIEDDITMRKRVVALSGGLAEVKGHGRSHIAQFIHQSVNDFLTKGGFACIIPSSTEDFIGQGHHRMARSCLNYLKYREVQHVLSNRYHIDLAEEAIIGQFPFIGYAASSLFSHAEKAEQRGLSQADLLQRFRWPSLRIFYQWAEIFERVDGRNPRLPAFRTTLFHVAANSNLLSVVQALLNKGVDVDEKDSDGKTALDYAYRWGHHALASSLLEAGAAFDDTVRNDSTPLERASGGMGYEPLVKFLLDHGADVNGQSDSGGALQSASRWGNIAIVQLLLDAGACVNTRGGYYGTALQAAVAHSHQEVVQILLDHGADINAQCGFYGNALQAAAASTKENVPLVRLLLRSGADVSAQAGLYGTGLSAAAFNCHETIMKLLIQHGADINANCGYYGTALQAAVASKSQEKFKIVGLLLGLEADVNAQGGIFRNALRAAEQQDGTNNHAIKQLLLEASATKEGSEGYSDQESLYSLD